MLKAAIEKILEVASPILHEKDGHTFVVTANGESEELRAGYDVPDCLNLNSLEALVKLIKTEAAGKESPLYITVPSCLKVLCFGQPQDDKRYHRQMYYAVDATDVPGWGDSVKMTFDQASVALRTRFQESTDLGYTLQLLSNITTGAKITYADNGIATSIVTSKGVALQENSVIRPLVKLRPYRTFQEIEQPEGMFLIRIDERGITFTEADGGMWKLAARKTIAKYLEDNLRELVEDGKVVIAL